jgi:hypothetical protein
MKELPIGIQSFSELRKYDFLYIDKTEAIFNLVKGSKVHFLSRPRRFGKSLLVSTLKELFLGNKELFKGLFIEDKIEWETFPVIHLDFAKSDYKQLGLEKSIELRLEDQAKLYDISLETETISNQFEELIRKLYKKFDKRVVLLIDEYDKPIIDFLGKDEIHIAIENRDIMKNFYTPIKSLDNYLRFFFLTGVSKFSKVSIFSDLNHLSDLTVDSRFSSLVGYTQKELEYYFDDYIDLLAEKNDLDKKETLDKLRQWYNGYSWTGEERVYNPFSVMNALQKSNFNNYWFETGTPTFLTKLMAENQYYDMDNTIMDLLTLGNFNITNIEPVTVLFQTGYLTLLEEIETNVYSLGYPNKEVKNSMLKMLLNSFTYQMEGFAIPLVVRLKHALQKADFDTIFMYLKSLFAKVPYQIFEQHKESYYHSIIFLTFELLGYYADAEVNTSIGRIDAVVRTEKYIFVFEFKVSDTAEKALQQIKDRKYYEKYLSEKEEGKTIYLIGVACQEKTITDYLIEEM